MAYVQPLCLRSAFAKAATGLLAGALSFGFTALFTVDQAQAQEEGKAALSARSVEDTGWLNGGDFGSLGDPNAKRDLPNRPLKLWWQSFPTTLRTDGPNSNSVQTRTLHALIYETMIGIHPETEEFLPSLAKEWRLEKDTEKGTQTFWFRLNPKARFSNGEPVEAEDVHASWWHRVQEDRKDPSNVLVFGQFDEPVVVDNLTIKVTTKKLNWRRFLYFGGIYIFPKEDIMIPGEEYLKKYNWEFLPGSGPYILADAKKDMKQGDSLTLTRRTDWWAEEERWAKNTYNFGKIKGVVISDRELLYLKFLDGEFDHYRIGKAQRWVEEVPKVTAVMNGWIKQRKIYNQSPEGFAGFAFNMRKPPFDDVRVRKAFALLFNRERLNEKLFFNEYEMIDSYFPGRDWGNEAGNPEIRFDPDTAEDLLWEAGYEERDENGYLLGPDGKPFTVTLTYGTQAWDRIWLVVKEDYEDAGINLELKLIDASTLMKKVSERQFTLHFQSWGALLFPNPRTSWSSVLAGEKYNNNLTGFGNAEVDVLLTEYDETFDRVRQKEITREIDRIVFEQYPYALGWYGPYERILYWDRFGHPDCFWSRIGQDPDDGIIAYWWWDKEKMATLEAAEKSGKKLPQGQVIHKPWDKAE